MLDDSKLSFNKRTGSPDSLVPLSTFICSRFEVVPLLKQTRSLLFVEDKDPGT